MLAAYGYWLTMKTKPVHLPGVEAAPEPQVTMAAQDAQFSQLPYNARRKLAAQRNANIQAARVARKIGKGRAS